MSGCKHKWAFRKKHGGYRCLHCRIEMSPLGTAQYLDSLEDQRRSDSNEIAELKEHVEGLEKIHLVEISGVRRQVCD